MEQTKNEFHARFSGASWYKFPQEIIVGGAGGIGSWLTMLLARQGHNLYVFDTDVVDKTNLGGQLYAVKDVGSSKVVAASRISEYFSAANITAIRERYEIDSAKTDIMFSCFDNMASRKTMFRNWCDSWNGNSQHCLFIDGRLNAETAEMFCVYDARTAALYEETLFDDSKVEDAPCTFKATSHCAAILAGLMVSALDNHIANVYAGEQRSVPFKTSIWLPTLTINSED